jgi:predicted ATPase
MAEAAAQLQKGLDQLARLPDIPLRHRQELEFWSALGTVLGAVKGLAAPETGRAYERARELWEQLGSPSEFNRIPFGQNRYYAFRGELDLAQRVGEDLLRLSRQRNDPSGLVLGHQACGASQMLAGRFASSRSHLDEALALYDPISHRSLVGQFASRPDVISQGYLAIVLFCLGFPDQALAQGAAAVARAKRLDHPPSLAGTLSLGTPLLVLIGDGAALREWADQMASVSAEQGFSFWRALATAYSGWAKVDKGDFAEGISLLCDGAAAFRATGAETMIPFLFGLLATALATSGQIEKALVQLDEALQIVARTGERWFAAELHRHKGHLLLLQGHTEAAEELYRKALSIAAEQEAKLWELRAAVSLARLRRDQGRRAEARDLLAPVHNWFTEGFDTPDLKEAKALLDELT